MIETKSPLSYTNSLVILEHGGELYNLKYEYTSISSMTVSLQRLTSDGFSWLSPDSLQLETGEVCVYIKMPSDHPHSNSPLPGVYVKSYGHGLGLIWVLYRDGQLIGMKLTG